MTGMLLLLGSVVCWGQRRGGFHGGAGFAGHTGMRAGGGFHAGASNSVGRNSFSGAPRSGFHSGTGFHHPGNGFHHPDRGRRFHDHHFNGRFRAGINYGYPYNYSYGYPYFYSPFWWDWADSSYDSQPDNSYAQYQANAEINRLSDEGQQLRDEQRDTQYPPAPPQAARPTAEARPHEDLPVVLVFLDKRIQEVKNYAVANEMLVVLEGNRRRKYPLADIDLAATMKLNDERGVTFEVPNPVISQ